MPSYSVPCWVISWPDTEYTISFLRLRKSKDDQQTFTASIKSMAEVKCRSEPGPERHQDILSWNPLSFLIQNIKNVVCRFSLVSQWTPLTVTKNPICSLAFLFLKWNVLILIMYFCYQSENAYICYVIVFDKQVTLYSRLFVFFFWWVMSALSALWTDSRIRLWFFIIRLLFIHAFTLYRALLQLIEATNIARCSWTAGGRQSTKSERPSRTSVLRFVDGKGHVVPCEQRPIDLPI